MSLLGSGLTAGPDLFLVLEVFKLSHSALHFELLSQAATSSA